MTFSQLLTKAVQQKKNSVLVGLDPRLESLPESLRTNIPPKDCVAVSSVFEYFCCRIIDIVAPLVPAVKPQAAFFEQYGAAGMQTLENVIQYARSKDLVVIFDGKRNDIGSTAEAYAAGILGKDSPWKADALTVSPYLGDDSLEPFVKTAVQRNAGIFVLVKTSNKGGGMLQDLQIDGKPLYRHIAEYVQKISLETKPQSGKYGSVGAVVGATYPEQLAELRAAMPNCWFLVPGFGAQGGAAKDAAAAFDSDGLGAVINNSRGIIFAYQKEPFRSQFGEKNWEQAVEAATKQMIAELKS
ncbi:MAG: orotidine-5'-phosphate decarboxylase [Planctomycetaceae bacterium]|nr:orotidine-5'-phosphate decarboxylase [Planctomycetaceae bacterium]